ncbi:MAG: carbohydrate-binding family 9-like protein [Bacteroidia bacterium]|nr:carbohydrate-binding family 9-like protein [Bacteroidia bacterium]
MLIPKFGFGQVVPNSVLHVKSTVDFELTGDSSAAWNKTFWVRLPHRGGVKKYQTKIKVLYSPTGIYCLFYCEDEKITSTLREDFTDLYLEDVVEAFFWTDEAKPLYFEYELSPHNFELPILVPNDSGNFFGWLPWHYEGVRKTRHATKMNAKSWSAEFFIPYALLKPLAQVPPVKGTKWRCNFYRLDYDEGSSKWSWQLTGPSFHDIERFGTLIFE